MASAGPSTNPTSPPPHPAIPSVTPASPPNKRDLKSWWKGFKLASKHQDTQEQRPQGIFGVPLRQSITYANVAISLVDENGQSYIYGYVPIVVAKCGVFLKEKATGIEGIFRLSGSEKRIKELKTLFDSPDRYGKGLVWDGYTVHDAANVLRRYLNDLPEPVVPLDLYEKFRDPLRGATKQAVGDAEGPQFIENFDERSAIERYQKLITELPPLNRQLLLYILDLLAVFAAKSDENRMNSQNLAAIFQPGMLSHPAHAMAPEEYRLNQCVLIFLIENQDHFLIGMQGTAADETTKKEVELGTGVAALAPTTPTRNNQSSIGRSSSNASAGADSVRRDGKMRRNRSVSSKHSKHDGNTTPNSPALAVTPTTGGLGRSNTVPSKKSPALAGAKFSRHDSPGPHSPLEPLTQAHPVGTPTHSEKSSLAPPIGGAVSIPQGPSSVAGRSQERLLAPHEASTPTKERSKQSLFQRSPTDEGKRPPNKLKKRRAPGSINPSAQSSNTSLPAIPSAAVSPNTEGANPLDQAILSEGEATRQHHGHPQAAPAGGEVSDTTPKPSINHEAPPAQSDEFSKVPPPVGSLIPAGNGKAEGDGNHKPATASFTEHEGEGNKTAAGNTEGLLQQPVLAEETVNASNASLSSSLQKPRKSFTGDSTEATSAGASWDQPHNHDSSRDGKDESKGPIGWIRNKYREAKENHEQRRNKSPTGEGHSNGHGSRSRGKSLDIRREPRESRDTREDEKQPAPPAATQLPQQQTSVTTQPPPPQSPVTQSTPPTVETSAPSESLTQTETSPAQRAPISEKTPVSPAVETSHAQPEQPKQPEIKQE